MCKNWRCRWTADSEGFSAVSLMMALNSIMDHIANKSRQKYCVSIVLSQPFEVELSLNKAIVLGTSEHTLFQLTALLAQRSTRPSLNVIEQSSERQTLLLGLHHGVGKGDQSSTQWLHHHSKT